MTTEVDRSRIIAFQRCPRERYLAYHHLGKGLQRKAKSLPLQVGSAFHTGAELLLRGNIDGAVLAAQLYLSNAFQEKGVSVDSEESSDQSLIYSAQEQVALTEALIRAWGLEKLPQFLQDFEVLEVEREGRAVLTGIDTGDAIPQMEALVLMFRPDALVRDRLSGDLYVVSWKTASTYNKRTLQQCKTDMQSMSEVWGLQAQSDPDYQTKIEGVLYLFMVKGKRSLDDWDQQWKQGTHLIYAWKKVKPSIDEFDDGWSWTYKWPKEDGSGNSTLGKGWKKVSVWDNYPGGVKAWIDALHNREVFPRHLDPFESVFPQSLPVERRVDEVEHWKRQVVAQEMRVATYVESLADWDSSPELFQEFLDERFPQHTGACHQYSGCQFIPICHEGIQPEENELYTIRSANHPESEDSDD